MGSIHNGGRQTMIYRPDDTTVNEFLQHSNYIENERSDEALADAWEAWDYAYSHRHKLTLGCGLTYILDIHKLLMCGLNPRIAGTIRACDVWINGKLKPFISTQLIIDDLQFYVINTMSDSPSAPYFKGHDLNCFTRQTHIEFEAIHPFEDGNGRVGRILYAIHRLKLELPIHIIHDGEEQKEYYKWFEEME